MKMTLIWTAEPEVEFDELFSTYRSMKLSMKLSTATPLLLLLAPSVESASETQPHYHRGVLKPYALGPPDILLSSQDERQLRTGKAVTQALASEDETRRLVMVQDINAPHQIVMSRISKQIGTLVSLEEQCYAF